MGLKVIGAGWGRTGTESLKKALEILGFGKCYHMFELIRNGEDIIFWEELNKGNTPDYEKLFEGYQSAVDFPACLYYREFMVQYPEAKVILSYRDAEQWYASARKTIFRPLPKLLIPASRFLGLFNRRIAYLPLIYEKVMRPMFEVTLEGKANDHDHMIIAYNQWVMDVKRNVPAHKLLVFEASDGWEPLCKFLDVPIPSLPYPHGNDSEEFRRRTKPANFLKEFARKAD